MKKATLFLTGIATLAILALATPSFAADTEKAAKERTITGEGKCAKCSLKETETCQNVVEVENAKGKKVKYYLVHEGASKDFHSNICKEAKKVKVTGTVKKVDGKNEMTVTKIDLVKE